MASRDSNDAEEDFLSTLTPPSLECDDLGPVVGQGTFSMVYRVPLAETQGQQHAAVKVFKSEYLEDARREIDIHLDLLRRLRMRNPNLIQFLGAMEMQAGNGGTHVLVGSEWIDGPNIHQLLARMKTLSEEQKMVFGKHVTIGVLTGLAVLGKNGYVHNDMKADNVMYDPKSRRAIIADFNKTTRIGGHESAGHPLFTGPERMGAVGTGNRSGKDEATLAHFVGMQLQEREENMLRIRATHQSPTDRDLLFAVEEKRLALTKEVGSASRRYHNLEPATRKSDSFAAGQLLYLMTQGEYFTLSKVKQSSPFIGQDLEVSTMFSMPQFTARGTVFLEADQSDDGKKQAGHYDFINHAMNPDRMSRWSPEELLQHRFLTENISSEHEVHDVLVALRLV